MREQLKFIPQDAPKPVLSKPVRPKKTRIQQLLSREAAAPFYHEEFAKLKPIVATLAEPEPIFLVKKLPKPAKILPPPPLIEMKGPPEQPKKQAEESKGSANPPPAKA